MFIDTNRRTTSKLGCLSGSGVKGIIRYYARTTLQPEKRLTRAEAGSIIASGLSIGVVHQAGGASSASFSAELGRKDARYAFNYAIEEIGQPDGSTLFFAVDFDCNKDQLKNNIIPHFKSIRDINQSGEFSKQYVIGAYGNGLVLSRLLDDGLIQFAWLSQSLGHAGSREFKRSNRWTLFQRLPSTLCGLGVDVDELNSNAPGFGQFKQLDNLAKPERPANLINDHFTHFVNATNGLNLRVGPGIEFEKIRLLLMNTPLKVLSMHGDWAIVDVDGNDTADGAVHAAFIIPLG